MNGLDLDAMIVGLMAASFSTFWLDTVNNIPKAAAAILFSAMLAGVAAPVVTVYVTGEFPGLVNAGNALPLLVGALIGSTVTWGFPLVINYCRNKWGQNA